MSLCIIKWLQGKETINNVSSLFYICVYFVVWRVYWDACDEDKVELNGE